VCEIYAEITNQCMLTKLRFKSSLSFSISVIPTPEEDKRIRSINPKVVAAGGSV